MLTKMFTMVTGKTIKHMDMVSIDITMEHIISGIGRRINSMEMVLKHGLMELDTRDSIMKARNTEMDI